MPRTMAEGFRDFLSKLTPSSWESEAAQRHRASIEACLKANFDIRNFYRIGSFGNGTSISGYSDVDYIASISHSTTPKPDNSENTLQRVRNALDYTFPRTGVRVNCPAVKLPFGTDAKETTEVVPAYFVKSERDNKIYDIADGYGGWMRASPDMHNEYVRTIDQKLEGKVKPLIRFVKAWKYYQRVPISSFYLELRIAKYAESENSIIYNIDIQRIFSMLDRIELASMQDPKGISGYIKACSSDVMLEESRSKLSTALARATKANEAKSEDRLYDAFEWWKLLFGEGFPSYYF